MLGLAVFGEPFVSAAGEFIGREYVDAWGTQWFYWWTGRQVLAGEGFDHTDVLFFPWGKDVYLHTGGNVLDGVLALPFRWLLGPVWGFNTFVVAVLASNAAAFATLARVTGARPASAAIAAALFAFNPFTLNEIVDGRPTQAMQAFILLFLADVARLARGAGILVALRAGVLLAVTGLGYWFYALFGGLAALVVGLAVVYHARPGKRVTTLFPFAVTGLAGLLLAAPFALPMVASSAAVPGLLDTATTSLVKWTPVTREGVGVGIYVVNLVERVAGFLIESKDEPGTLVFVAEDRAILLTEAALGLLGLAFGRARGRLVVAALLLTGLVVAAGPVLRVGGLELPNVPYLTMISAAPLLRRLWWPQRAMVLVSAGLALGVAHLLSRAEARWRPLLIVVALPATLSWALELRGADLAPLPTWSAAVPRVYQCLRHGGDAGALIELPYASSQAHLFYQAVHGRKIFGGMVEDNLTFTPAGQVAFRESNSFIGALLAAARDEAPGPVDEADRIAVGALGYAYVVFDRAAYAPPGAAGARVDTRNEGRGPAAFRRLVELLGRPAYVDPDSALWAPWGHAEPCGVGRGAPLP